MGGLQMVGKKLSKMVVKIYFGAREESLRGLLKSDSPQGKVRFGQLHFG